MLDYHYELSSDDHCTLYFALGYATSAAMKEHEPNIAKSFFQLARKLSTQFQTQIGETPDGKTDPAEPNALSTDGIA